MAGVNHNLVPMLYKGAGPGTWWAQNDARVLGFSAPVNVIAGVNLILGHINTSPQRSPCISFTTSYAIALQYATFGPVGPATPATPGYVYCIDMNQLHPLANVVLLDPIVEIAGQNGSFAHGHNGGSVLIEEIAKTVVSFTHPAQRSGKTGPPTITPALQALVRAIRDAEVLVNGIVPKGAVVDRDDIY